MRTALNETNDIISEIEQSWQEQANAVIDYETAVTTALDKVSESLQAVADNYNAAYEAAYNGISGTVGLFNTLETTSDLSAGKMQAAMESQIAFIAKYEENLQKASQYGLSGGLVASLSDGSAESAGYINTIVAQIEQLNPQKAAEFVANFNSQFAGVQEAKDSFSTAVAEMNTDFTAGIDSMTEYLTGFVDNMDLSTEAAKAAKDTINAYMSSMEAAVRDYGIADVEGFTKEFLYGGENGRGGYFAAYPVEANANGTTNAADIFIAGEKGPELIVGMAGSTVFPAEETEKILNGFPVPENLEYSRTEINENRSNSTKTIKIELAGSGEIKVDGKLSEDEAWELFAPRLKPEFIKMLQQDIFEEGDLSYGF
jgi:hypothetical protein